MRTQGKSASDEELVDKIRREDTELYRETVGAGTIKSSSFAFAGTELTGCGLSECMNLVPKWRTR